ncbi:MAG TPA: 3-isopropylmalate dehydratase small subunit [Thermoanaerobaculia bacterium]|jgi:3-isopropylmalate/(R)-2-methylmalate dehydratase small subunit|nr:3-isopropylmalate dehydratase small subunit [Thermoanaerobaculia bacterium]
MRERGTAHVYSRAHVNTDEIIPARYLNVHDEKELALHALEDIDDGFVRRVSPGDFLVAGDDFGCGSSREHAVWALRGAGVRAVIARSFARLFFRNAINNGFLALECAEAVDTVVTGDTLELDVEAGILRNLTRGGEARFVPLSTFARELLQAGGLLPYVLARRAGAEATR